MGEREAENKRRRANLPCVPLPHCSLIQDLFTVLLNEEFALKKKRKQTQNPLLHQLNVNSCESSQIKKPSTLVPSFRSHLFALAWAQHKPGPRADLSSAPTATSRESPTCTSLAQHRPFSPESSTEIAGATCAKIDSFHVK